MALNFSVVGIRWRRFLANIFPLSFKISYDRGRLFWLTTIDLLTLFDVDYETLAAYALIKIDFLHIYSDVFFSP